MIKVIYSELDGPKGPTCRLEATGHAGYAPAGQDIVCAGASTLMQALVYLLAGTEGTASLATDRPEGPSVTVTAVNKSDVDLADASNAIIIGFNVRPDNVAKEAAAATKVEMRMYRVIYDAINDVTDAMKGMLAPKYREVALGELQVRQVYKISNVGTVAGCRVTNGKITRDSKVRVVRDGIVLAEDEIASLKRFKDDAKEVAEGFECGVTLAKFNDVKEGDVYEAFKMEEYRD